MDTNTPNQPLSPELVRKIADKVYALWLRDLQIEQERKGKKNSKTNKHKR